MPVFYASTPTRDESSSRKTSHAVTPIYSRSSVYYSSEPHQLRDSRHFIGFMKTKKSALSGSFGDNIVQTTFTHGKIPVALLGNFSGSKSRGSAPWNCSSGVERQNSGVGLEAKPPETGNVTVKSADL